MRIAVLTHAEAADSAVFANLAKHLFGDQAAISYVDRPDVGKGDAPLALAQPVATPSPAALVFGGAQQPPIPPAPAVPSVPSAATAPTAAPAAAPAAPGSSGPQLDSRGLPWDVRIHASTKVFVADGSWRQKRGTPPELVAQVEAELRQVMGIPTPPPAVAPAPAVPPAPVINSVFAAGAAAADLPPPVLVPPAPAAEAAPAVPAAPTGEPQSFADLMLWLTPHMPHKLPPEKLNETLAAFGVPSLNALISRPDLVPAIAATLKPLVA